MKKPNKRIYREDLINSIAGRTIRLYNLVLRVNKNIVDMHDELKDKKSLIYDAYGDRLRNIEAKEANVDQEILKAGLNISIIIYSTSGNIDVMSTMLTARSRDKFIALYRNMETNSNAIYTYGHIDLDGDGKRCLLFPIIILDTCDKYTISHELNHVLVLSTLLMKKDRASIEHDLFYYKWCIETLAYAMLNVVPHKFITDKMVYKVIKNIILKGKPTNASDLISSIYYEMLPEHLLKLKYKKRGR